MCYLHEGDASKVVHDLWHSAVVDDGLDDVASHVLHVSVANDIAGACHSTNSSILDLLLGVRHAGCDCWYNCWQASSQVVWCVVAEGAQSLLYIASSSSRSTVSCCNCSYSTVVILVAFLDAKLRMVHCTVGSKAQNASHYFYQYQTQALT
jgi:hypothetical protein